MTRAVVPPTCHSEVKAKYLCVPLLLPSDAKCGKIQCHSAAKKPKGTNAVSIDTTIRTDGIEVKCRGTYVYSTQDGQGDLPDPGLVMTGTKCAEGKVGLQWAGPQGEPKESVNQVMRLIKL